MRIAIGAITRVDLKQLLAICAISVTSSSIPNEHAAVDYPDYAEALAKRFSPVGRRGVLICGSGVGASVSANKIPGIRAGLCHNTYSARQGVEHDQMNVLVLGARVVGVELARELVDNFLAAKFCGEERHQRRVEKIAALERRYGKSA
jgi:RpiB/LacA/LacB family sugar-phosphate isomerase